MRIFEITKRELDAQKLKVSKDEWDSADDEMKSDIKSHNRTGVIKDVLAKMDGGVDKLKRDLDNKSILAWSDGSEGLIGARQGPNKIVDMLSFTPVDLDGPKRSRVLPGEEGSKEELLKYAEGRQLVDLKWNSKAKELFDTPAGIYIWTHPKFGIFYIGIMGSDLEQRWTSHVTKMLGRYKDQGKKDSQGNPRSRAPVNWVKFSQDLLSKEGSQIKITSEQAAKELSDISVSFYPINKPEGVGTSFKKPGERGYEDYDRWKKGLEAIEKRLVTLVTGMKMNKNNLSKMKLLNDEAAKLEKEIAAQRAQIQKAKNS